MLAYAADPAASSADSPRVYVSTNPWKITSSFLAVSSDREEYVALVAQLKELSPPSTKAGEKAYKKTDLNHIRLVQALEDRLPAIDAEIAVSRTWFHPGHTSPDARHGADDGATAYSTCSEEDRPAKHPHCTS